MRQQRYDGNQRQCRMHAREVEPPPREAAGKDEERPRSAKPGRPQRRGDAHGSQDEHGTGHMFGRELRLEREHRQADGVGGDAGHQQEGERLTAAPIDQPEHVVPGGDVHGRGDRPGLRQHLFVRPRHVGEKGECCAGDATGRSDQWHPPVTPVSQGAAGPDGVDRLVGDQREEQRHADLVDREGEPVREGVVPLRIQIGPDHGNERANRQPEEAVVEEMEDTGERRVPAHDGRYDGVGRGVGLHDGLR